MNKNKITKFKKNIFNLVSDICSDDDIEPLCEKICVVIDEYYDNNLINKDKPKQSKPYLASTGSEEKQNSVIRTKGDSQRGDSIRGIS